MFDIFYLNRKPTQIPSAVKVESIEQAQRLARTRYFWIVDYLCDYHDWDFLWEPAPWEKDFRHAFASQHQSDSETYLVPKTGYTETKYNEMVIPRLPSKENWINDEFNDFDYSWHPAPAEPPYIYHFPTQHQRTGGPVYTAPSATDIKYVDVQQVKKKTVDSFWNTTDYKDFDYTWHPDSTDAPYIYQFGTQHQKTGGPRYTVPGATEIKYVNQPRVTKTDVDPHWCIPDNIDFEDFDYTWHPDSTDRPFIYQFGTQWQKTGGPRYVMPGATEIKYVNQPRIIKTNIDNYWEVPDNIDFEDFDYTWHPDSTDTPFIYQFATQHQKTGGPRYVMPGATEIKYVDEIKIRTHKVATGIVMVKHTNCISELSTDIPIIETTRFISDYLGTLRRVCNKIQDHEYIWVVSDLCDYTDFDFSWHPEIWQNTMLHVFPSNEQKFGDTFFIHVSSFLEKTENLEVLEWFNPLNFVQEKSVHRKEPIVIKYSTDDLAEAVLHYTFNDPVVQFYRHKIEKPITISLWQKKMKTIVPLNNDSSTVLVPRETKNYIKTQLYDYPYVDKKHRPIKSSNQDIVFISYDEPNADKNFDLLKNKFPRAKRIHGIEGMVPALKAAAEVSETDYYYAVFAKTQIHENFDFQIQPDYLKQPCHYLFHGKNMSNGLEYGTLGVTMYNCRLVIEASEWDVDFTTSFPVEVVPVLSAYGYFATDPLRAWRTAFRECTKLQSKCIRNQVTLETEYRLNIWTTQATGPYSDWVLQGAKDGVDYANSGEDIMQINDWNWLTEQFQSKYSSTLSAT